MESTEGLFKLSATGCSSSRYSPRRKTGLSWIRSPNFITSIRVSLLKNTENDANASEYGKIMNNVLLTCIQHRFQKIMSFDDENKELLISAAVHPSFKLTWVTDEKDMEYVQSLLINSYIDFVNSDNTQRNEEQSSSMPGCSLEQQNSFESNEKTFFQHFRTSTDDSLTFDIWKYMLQPIADASPK